MYVVDMDSDSDTSENLNGPAGCHVLIIGDYNYKKCRDFSKRYKAHWKLNVPAVDDIQLHRLFYGNGSLNNLKKEYESHKKKHGLPHIVVILGGNRDIARVENEQVIVTKLCRIASKMRKDGVYKVAIGSLLPCGYLEQFQEFNSRVQNANDLLDEKAKTMSGTYFLRLIPKADKEEDKHKDDLHLKMAFDSKNKRYLSETGYVIYEKIVFTHLKDKLVPLIKAMKLDYKKNLKNVVTESATLRMESTRFIDSEGKIGDLKKSLNKLEESRRVLLDDKKKLEFVLRSTSAKLTKIDSYVSGVKALIDTVQDTSSID